MTPQEKIVLLGAAGIAVSKFYFKQDWKTAAAIGLGVISVYAILTAKSDE